MIFPIKIGSRQSRLAKIQVQEILSMVGAGSKPAQRRDGLEPPLRLN